MTTQPNKRSPNAAYFMLLIGFFCAVLSVFLTPPLNVLDGQAHWKRMYQVSQFDLTPTQYSENELGGDLEWSAIRLSQLAGDAFGTEEPSEAHLFRNWAAALQQDKSQKPVGQIFSSSSVYTPLAYLPGAIAIAISRMAGFNILDQYFIAAIANAATFFALIALCLRLVSGLHIAIVAIATAPSLLFMAGSISGDPINIAIPLLFLSYCWSLREQQIEITKKQLILLGIGMLLLAMLKPIMILFASFVLIIQTYKLESDNTLKGDRFFSLFKFTVKKWIQKNTIFFLIGIPALIFWFVWNQAYSFDPGSYFGWETNPDAIQKILLRDPFAGIGFIFSKMFEQPWLIWAQSLTFAGGHGNGYAVAAPMAITAFIWLAIAWSILFEPPKRRSLKVGLFLLLLSLLYAFAVYLGFWIWMSPPESGEIRGVQPRYFLFIWIVLAISISFIIGGRARFKTFQPVIATGVMAANVGAWALPLTHFSRLWIW